MGVLSVNKIESEDLSMTLTKNPSIHTASHCGEKEKDPTVLDLLNLRQGVIPISKRNKMKDHKFIICRKQDACFFTFSSQMLLKTKTKFLNELLKNKKKPNFFLIILF